MRKRNRVNARAFQVAKSEKEIIKDELIKNNPERFLTTNNTASNSSDTLWSQDDGILFGNTACFCLTNSNKLRKFIQIIVGSKIFVHIINIIIVVNCVFLILETIPNLFLLNYFSNYVFTSIFIIECLLKIVAYGFILEEHSYLRDPWNWIDFIVVVTGLISFMPEINANLLAWRSFRWIRPLKTISMLPNMRLFISTFFDSLLDVGTVFMMLWLFLIIFAIMGLSLWYERFDYRCRKEITPVNGTLELDPWYKDKLCGGQVNCGGKSELCLSVIDFYRNSTVFWTESSGYIDELDRRALNFGLTTFNNFGASWWTVFQTMTCQGWSKIMFILMDGYNYYITWIYFVLCVIINYFFMLNLIVAVLLYNFSQARKQEYRMVWEYASKTSKKEKKEIVRKTINININIYKLNGQAMKRKYQMKYPQIELLNKNDTSAIKNKLGVSLWTRFTQIPCFTDFERHNEYHKKYCIAYACYFIYKQPLIQYFFYFCIFINSIMLALDRVNVTTLENQIIEKLNIVLVGIFSVEIMLLLIGTGWVAFVKDMMNVWDFIIVIVSLLEIILKEKNLLSTKSSASWSSTFRMLRILRIFKWFRSWESFHIIMESILETIIRMTDYIIWFILFLFIYTLLGFSFFQNSLKFNGDTFSARETSNFYNFDNFPNSLVSVFIIIIGDHWYDLFYECFRSNKNDITVVLIYYITLVLFGQIALMNIFWAYLIDNFQTARSYWEKNLNVKNFVTDWTYMTFQMHSKSIFNIKDKTNPYFFYFLSMNSLNKKDMWFYEEFKWKAKQKINWMTSRNVNIDSGNDNSDSDNDIDIKVSCSGGTEAHFEKREKKNPGRTVKIIDWETYGLQTSKKIEDIVDEKYMRKNYGDYDFDLDYYDDWINVEYEFARKVPFNKQISYENIGFLNNIKSLSKEKMNELRKKFWGLAKVGQNVDPEGNQNNLNNLNNNNNNWDSNGYWTTDAQVQLVEDNPNNNNNNNNNIINNSTKTMLGYNYTKKNTKIERSSFKLCYDKFTDFLKSDQSLFIFGPTNKVRVFITKVVNHKVFIFIIFIVVLLTCITICIDSPYINPDGITSKVLQLWNFIFNIVFIIEALLKIISIGWVFHEKTYMRSPWNLIDLFCVIIGIIEMVNSDNINWKYLRVFRAMRSIKPIRLIIRSENLSWMTMTLARSLPALGNLLLVCGWFIIIFALWGVNLFKTDWYYYCDLSPYYDTEAKCLEMNGHWTYFPENYSNFILALKANFEIMMIADWANIMRSSAQLLNSKNVFFYFISFVIIGNMFILNLIVAVVIQKFSSLKKKANRVYNLTQPEREWVHAQKIMMKFHPWPDWSKVRTNCTISLINTIVLSPTFERSISLMIILSSLTLVWQYNGASKQYNNTIEWINYVFTFWFNIEWILKLIVYTKYYFLNVWNRFDFVIILISDVMVVLNILTYKEIINIHSLSALPIILRLFRMFRILRVLSTFSKLRAWIDTLLYLIPSIGNITILVGILLLIYGNIGMNLFGTVPYRDKITPNNNFRNFIQSAIWLFEATTGEEWNNIMNEVAYHDCRDPTSKKYSEDIYCYKYNVICYDDEFVNYTSLNYEGDAAVYSCGNDLSYVFFITFIWIGPVFIMNLCVVMVIEGFSDSMHENEGILPQNYMDKFVSAWLQYDPKCNWKIKPYEFILIWKQLPPPIGFNYDRHIMTDVYNPGKLSKDYKGFKYFRNIIQKTIQDYYKRTNEIKHNHGRTKNVISDDVFKEILETIRFDRKDYPYDYFYISRNFQCYTNDVEVMRMVDMLEIGENQDNIDWTKNKEFLINKHESYVVASDRVNPILLHKTQSITEKWEHDNNLYVHFIDACVVLSRFAVSQVSNITFKKLRTKIVGKYTKKLWKKEYDKTTIEPFFPKDPSEVKTLSKEEIFANYFNPRRNQKYSWKQLLLIVKCQRIFKWRLLKATDNLRNKNDSNCIFPTNRDLIDKNELDLNRKDISNEKDDEKNSNKNEICNAKNESDDKKREN